MNRLEERLLTEDVKRESQIIKTAQRCLILPSSTGYTMAKYFLMVERLIYDFEDEYASRPILCIPAKDKKEYGLLENITHVFGYDVLAINEEDVKFIKKTQNWR